MLIWHVFADMREVFAKFVKNQYVRHLRPDPAGKHTPLQTKIIITCSNQETVSLSYTTIKDLMRCSMSVEVQIRRT